MYKWPIQIPGNLKLTVVQSFHERAPTDLSQALSIQTIDHIGTDVVCGTNEQTWGQNCVWPFPWPGVVYESLVDSMFGATLHAHAQIDTTDPTTGVQYSLIYIHLSSVTNSKAVGDGKTVIYNFGEVIGKIGNNGAVSPMPTPACPLCGTHLHSGLGVKKPGELNYTMVDPQLFFDINDPFLLPGGDHFKFNKNLYFGIQDPDCIELQNRLGVFPTYAGFGPKTLLAVIAYQKAHNITPAAGFVGPITRASLNTSN